MVYRTFEELVAKLKASPRAVRMAVAAAGDEHTIEAVLNARREGIVSPILVGDKALIDAALEKFGATVPKRMFLICGLGGYSETCQHNRGRGAIGQVVEGVGDNRNRAAHQANRQLHAA